MNINLINEEDLKDWTGFKQRSDLVKWLKSKQIDFEYGKGGRICVVYHDLVHQQPSFEEIRLEKKSAA